MLLIDLLKVMDDDTRICIEVPKIQFPYTGYLKDIMDEIPARYLECRIENVRYSPMYYGIYIVIEL